MVDTSVRIDWLAFTVNGLSALEQVGKVDWVAHTLNTALSGLGYGEGLFNDGELLNTHAHHKPYSWGLEHARFKGLVFMFSDKRDECLIEFQGQFCAMHPELTLSMLSWFRRSVTRVDVALDLVTDLRPMSAVLGHTAKTVTASTSQSGETVYLGSQKSEYYARVYRYNPPHPRSDLLRCEVVYRRDHAKRLGEMVTDGTPLFEVVVAYLDSVKLSAIRELMDVRGSSVGGRVKVARAKSDKSADKRLRWLASQVNPAIEKMLGGGVTFDDLMMALPSIADLIRQKERHFA